jgi:hypothetical protein
MKKTIIGREQQQIWNANLIMKSNGCFIHKIRTKTYNET